MTIPKPAAAVPGNLMPCRTLSYLGPGAWGVGCSLLLLLLHPAQPPTPLHPPSPQHRSSRGARGTGTCPQGAQSARETAGGAQQSAHTQHKSTRSSDRDVHAAGTSSTMQAARDCWPDVVAKSIKTLKAVISR